MGLLARKEVYTVKYWCSGDCLQGGSELLSDYISSSGSSILESPLGTKSKSNPSSIASSPSESKHSE